MIRIAICDDEKECIDEVQKLLDKFLSKNFDYTFLTFNSGQDLLSHYDKNFKKATASVYCVFCYIS